jgi:methylaspartate mutase epsilon subunit
MTVPARVAGAAVAPPFGAYVACAHAAGRLVVQPRMGMSDPAEMRAGLLATANARATTVGTITLDSYTRIGDHTAARRALAERQALNGYPIVTHDAGTTRAVVRGLRFPIQVRHGSPRPQDIVAALLAAGLDATEGGPVSYCLPYSRTPLRESIDNWARGCEMLAGGGGRPHLETFGGCMLGQLCPPSLLIAVSVLEACFFRQHGLTDISLSYAQQGHDEQDREAIAALHRIATALLPDVDWHIVLYAYMGVYPRTPSGATALLQEAARLAVRTGAARLIVKTTAEAHRIPSIAENVAALESAAVAATGERPAAAPADTGILAEAIGIIDAVRELHDDIGPALAVAFARGHLDVPYCLHPDNAGRTRSYLDGDGRLRWSAIGAMPIDLRTLASRAAPMSATGLLDALHRVARRFDRAELCEGVAGRPLAGG